MKSKNDKSMRKPRKSRRKSRKSRRKSRKSHKHQSKTQQRANKSMSLTQLQSLARVRGIPFGGMKRDQLIKRINARSS